MLRFLCREWTDRAEALGLYFLKVSVIFKFSVYFLSLLLALHSLMEQSFTEQALKGTAEQKSLFLKLPC